MYIMLSIGLVLIVFILTKTYRVFFKHYATILYVSGASILYTAICRGYLLWWYPASGRTMNNATELLQATLLLPPTVLLYLRYFPKKRIPGFLYYLGFVSAFIVMESVWYSHGEIKYSHGWNLGYSAMFDLVMFSMIWLHEKNVKLTLTISVPFIIFLIWWFHVPL